MEKVSENIPEKTSPEPPYPLACRFCGVPVTEWDEEYGYVYDERGFATCGESDTAHALPLATTSNAPLRASSDG